MVGSGIRSLVPVVQLRSATLRTKNRALGGYSGEELDRDDLLYPGPAVTRGLPLCSLQLSWGDWVSMGFLVINLEYHAFSHDTFSSQNHVSLGLPQARDAASGQGSWHRDFLGVSA